MQNGLAVRADGDPLADFATNIESRNRLLSLHLRFQLRIESVACGGNKLKVLCCVMTARGGVCWRIQ